ncbi:hypothetical protein TcCL_Unassigned01162 [Trypanosoma cruzi]|nr:hypothetical protein TcCL_Unassigned01162 [Trypanosoma cruzi]
MHDYQPGGGFTVNTNSNSAQSSMTTRNIIIPSIGRHRWHRTTARRGHTPAAHGQAPSSPSLPSLACSLQHKPTPRQRSENKERNTTATPRTATAQKQTAAAQQQQQQTQHETDGISTIAELAHRPTTQKL